MTVLPTSRSRAHYVCGRVEPSPLRAPAAQGAPPPDHGGGALLSLVIDAKTFQGLDFGIGSKPPPVLPASLGPVAYLTGRSH